MLEKMGDFFDARIRGYEAHQLTTIDDAAEFYPFTAGQLPRGPEVLCGYGQQRGQGRNPDHRGLDAYGTETYWS